MSRKIIDIQPVISVTPISGPPAKTLDAAQRQAGDIRHTLRIALGDGFDLRTTFDTEARCDHCGAMWTEEGATYNGGCCDADEAANPAALPVPVREAL